MTLDQLVDHARTCATSPDLSLSEVRELARGVLDLLAEASPCGWTEPEVWNTISRSGVQIPADWCGSILPADETRALGRMLFRAADSYETMRETSAIAPTVE